VLTILKKFINIQKQIETTRFHEKCHRERTERAWQSPNPPLSPFIKGGMQEGLLRRCLAMTSVKIWD